MLAVGRKEWLNPKRKLREESNGYERSDTDRGKNYE